MPDLLIRNVPQEDLDALDEAARGLGISRTEFVRRHLLNEARRARARSVTRADFAFVSEAAVDLLDPDFRASAWR